MLIIVCCFVISSLISERIKSNKIVVVGIIGKTRTGKAHILNDIIDVPVFKVFIYNFKVLLVIKHKLKYHTYILHICIIISHIQPHIENVEGGVSCSYILL